MSLCDLVYIIRVACSLWFLYGAALLAAVSARNYFLVICLVSVDSET